MYHIPLFACKPEKHLATDFFGEFPVFEGMIGFLHPDDLSPDQRRAQIATLLARGYLRLRATPKDSAVNREEVLEAGGEKSVYASTKGSSK